MSQGCPEFMSHGAVSRRRMLQAGSAGLAGLALPALLRAERAAARSPRAKHIILLHQFGGPSHLDTFDMKPTAPEGIRGEFKPIATQVPGLHVSEHLPRFAMVIDRFAQIRSVNHRIKNHNSATYYSLTGHAPPIDDIRLRDTQELYPAYGSTVAKLQPARRPASAVVRLVSVRDARRQCHAGAARELSGQGVRSVLRGQGPEPVELSPSRAEPAGLAAAFAPRRSPRTCNSLSTVRPTCRAGPRPPGESMNSIRGRHAMLGSPKVKRAFDLTEEPERLRDQYGRTSYGQSCLLARRLIEAGVRFVSVYYSASIGGKGSGGWDTHGDNFNQLRNRLLPITDQTVPTLIEDLEARGLLSETLVVWMGEFGRSPKVQNTKQFGPDGRDHWPFCYTVLMAGGGITPGAIYGSSDRSGAYPATLPVTPDDIAATMFWALGIDPATEVRDTLGRPLPIAAGKPLTGLFS